MDTSILNSSSIDARVIDNDLLRKLGRLGWVAKGAVYVVMGILALQIAIGGGSSGEASRSGALSEIADQSFGGMLLVLVGVGLALYALWRVATAVLPGDTDAEGLAHRAGYLGSAALYGFLAWSAISFVTSGSGSSGSQGGQSSLETLSRTMMEMSGGRWLLGLGALVGLGVAGFYVVKGIDESFKERLGLADADQRERKIIETSGKAGWIGRGVTVGLLSFFVLSAAWTANPDEARGLDAALRSVADNWWGSTLIVVAGGGLVAYGVFAIVSARHRRLLGP